ncbi:MAG TPA: right-handed parallel beta-helix repeat-containing protein [Bryobacteraceae bacterium]|nr:right-handed parallel beta-helix repeat-containing protein [Bryobacteraceae bacterium]
MDQGPVGAILLVALLLAGCGSSEARLRKTLATQTTGVIRLPRGEVEISSELTLAPGAHDLEIVGNETRLKAADNFKGRAILVLENVERIHLHYLEIDGNRQKLAKPLEMAPPENVFRVWYPDNGLLVNSVSGLQIERLHLSDIVNFPILVSQSSKVRVWGSTVENSGSRNARGRNNLSGGILFEEGSSTFEVTASTFHGILGNALWTHSLFRAPRQQDGSFTSNSFDTIGRDAIQVGHATRVRVQGNTGVNIGFPVDAVDIENQGVPIGIDTAGNVDRSEYIGNTFDEIDGQCIDLDGFHDGSVRDNRCTNRKTAADYPFGSFAMAMNNTHPDTHSSNIEISGNVVEGSKFGGLFVMGSGNRVLDNVFLGLNLARGDEPEILTSGVYLGRGVARLEETTGNVIRGNRIMGYKMKARCIVFGPGVSRTANTVENNTCSDDPPGR